MRCCSEAFRRAAVVDVLVTHGLIISLMVLTLYVGSFVVLLFHVRVDGPCPA